MKTAISEQQIVLAQQQWAEQIIRIGETFLQGGNYNLAAQQFLDTLYGFEHGEVLFKPTKAAIVPFRTTREGALSYFIGGNSSFPEDKGFALQPWLEISFRNIAVKIHATYAVAMGHYFFTDDRGNRIKVEYTFGYFPDRTGQLKIDLHHSSLPYGQP